MVLAAGLAVGWTAALARSKAEPPAFPYATFSANEEVANWLIEYDWVAWKASDLVMAEPEEQLARLGPHWFCFRDARGWHALFGRYEAKSNVYQQELHYLRRGDEMVRTADLVDPALASRYGRALQTARAELPPEITKLPVAFNHYVRPIEGDKLEVWVLPAMQRDQTLVFGGDVRYVLDSSGAKILERVLNFKEFRAAKPDASLELNIDRQENDVPSVGDIFFIQQFGRQFKSVSVWTHCFLTRLIDSEGKELAWIHVQKQSPECEGKPSKRPRGAKAP